MKTTSKTARLFYCVSCHKPVVICSPCDRGNMYCGSTCSRRTRVLARRMANQKYQQSLKGRLKHAQRQRRYRTRKRVTEKKVTYQGSPDLLPHDVLPDRSDESQLQKTDTTHCYFCGDGVLRFLRNRFLRHPRDEGFSSWPNER